MKSILKIGVWLAAAVWGAATAQQPLEFPHDKHVARGLECLDCHSTADWRAEAGMPSLRKCMLCHRTVATEKPGVRQLLTYANQKREVPWLRIYGFEPGARVQFRHAPHIRAKVECQTCHGDVARMTVAQPAVRHTMGTCVTCHRQRDASADCTTCHY